MVNCSNKRQTTPEGVAEAGDLLNADEFVNKSGNGSNSVPFVLGGPELFDCNICLEHLTPPDFQFAAVKEFEGTTLISRSHGRGLRHRPYDYVIAALAILVFSALGMVASVLGGLVTIPERWVPSTLGRIASVLGNSLPRKEICLPQRDSRANVRHPSR
ncbi:hypothetical protein Sjap_018085 [Stephania japonica]|uniref:Uncharacterized protein n=1 Tax=Stephania japonica TaxID=461633 RepID=A0AAP0I7G4_9MAGN